MKKYLTAFLLAFSFSSANSQQIEGLWNGTLKIPGGQINVIFTITQKGNVYRAAMDIPAQNVKGLAASSVSLNEKKVTINLDVIESVYVGEVANDSTMNGEATDISSRYFTGMAPPLRSAVCLRFKV